MSQDVVADALNVIKNARRAGKEEVSVNRISKMLIEILKIMKDKGAIKKYKIDSKDKSVEVNLGDFSECRAIKPRLTAKKGDLEKYRRRYLPSRMMGTIIITNSKGLMTHEDAMANGLGGSLVAYFY